jgi:hypothetical protein
MSKDLRTDQKNRTHQHYASDRPVIPGTSLKYELF